MKRVIFERSDALAEQHGPIDNLEIIVPEDVQLTYGTLRCTETSNPIAEINQNTQVWYARCQPCWWMIGPFSDIIVADVKQ